MKYCTKCGAEIPDDAAFCSKCGCETDYTYTNSQSGETLKTVAKIFMIIGCVSYAFSIIPLCWTIPMTIYYFKKVDTNQPISIGFKICSLLFVSLVAGILMLCDQDQGSNIK